MACFSESLEKAIYSLNKLEQIRIKKRGIIMVIRKVSIGLLFLFLTVCMAPVPVFADWADEVKKALGFKEEGPMLAKDFTGNWINPYPTANTLWDVWGPPHAPSEVFVVGRE